MPKDLSQKNKVNYPFLVNLRFSRKDDLVLEFCQTWQERAVFCFPLLMFGINFFLKVIFLLSFPTRVLKNKFVDKEKRE